MTAVKKIAIASLAIVLLCVGFYFYAFHNNDLRGWWKNSPDGKTYLVIDGPGGTSTQLQFTFNGQSWPHAVGERGEIEPGCHNLDEVVFCVKQGVEYHFDYWGP